MQNNDKKCAPGSIEQQLDMCETGELRGDAIDHQHGQNQRKRGRPGLRSADEMNANYNMDMSEENREGDEMSGDDHSSGLQGGEPELENQPKGEEGMPGEATQQEESYETLIEKRRIA